MGQEGIFSSIPTIRRCWLGIAVLVNDSFSFGIYWNVPGATQTVPRAELLAVVLVLERVVTGAQVHIYTDHENMCFFFKQGEAVALLAINSDLRARLFTLASSKHIV